ncbi:MAG: hypothetical protein NTY08_13910 [Proteobacteria bacterium]|nr:hypothetical protein [Pseudomonadota bacterium]
MANSRILITTLSAVSFFACKTTASKNKDLPTESITQMTEQQWVDACQAELANPKAAAKARADLTKLANTTDCAAAYPVIKEIFEHYASKQ